MVELKSWHFSKARQAWVESENAPETAAVPRLRVLTFNIWFGEYHFEERGDTVLGLLRDYAPEVIALQEVTPPFLKKLLEQAWVRDHYHVSDVTKTSVEPYGVLLLARFPLQAPRLFHLPSGMHRKLKVAELHLNGQVTHIASIHLESKKHNEAVRAAQLRGALELLAPARHCLLLGDFNFCSSWPEENANIPPEYRDLWAALRPEEPGYTVDTDINVMRLLQKDKRKAARFDRVLLRSGQPGWVPRSIELIGTDPISPQYVNVFPSDHFGLVADLQWDAGKTPAAQ